MARPRRRRGTFDINNQHQGRDAFAVSNDLSEGVFEPLERSLPSTRQFEDYYTAVRSPRLEVEDRRQHYPAGRQNRPAASSRRHLVKTKPTKLSAFAQKAIQAFNYPNSVMICVRRKIRKEVMHALGKSGKGSRFQRKPKYNRHSKVRC